MAQLTADISRKFGITESPRSNEPVAAAATIFRGSAVGDNGAGYARQLVAADPFRGFAAAKADNAAGAAGAEEVEVRKSGEVELSVVGVTGVGDIDEPVYASDGNAFTLVAAGNTAVGKIIRYIGGTTVVVYFEAAARRSI